MKKTQSTGCWLCRYLEWYEAGPEEFESSGYYCGDRDDEPHLLFSTFPCKRRLKCFTWNIRTDE